jgi:hypothetical protein
MQGSNTRPEIAVQTIHCLSGIEKSAHFKLSLFWGGLLIGNRMRNLRTLYATKEHGFKTGYLLKGRREQKAVGMECMVPNEHPQQDPEYEQKMKSQSSYHSVCTIQNWCRMVPTWRNHPCLYCNNDWCAKTKMKEDEMVATARILS